MTRIPLSPLDDNARRLEERLGMSTAEIGLSVRTTNCLEERGIFTVEDLLRSKPEDLLGISNFGEKTLEEVYKALEDFGFVRDSKRGMMAAKAREDRAFEVWACPDTNRVPSVASATGAAQP